MINIVGYKIKFFNFNIVMLVIIIIIIKLILLYVRYSVICFIFLNIYVRYGILFVYMGKLKFREV